MKHGDSQRAGGGILFSSATEADRHSLAALAFTGCLRFTCLGGRTSLDVHDDVAMFHPVRVPSESSARKWTGFATVTEFGFPKNTAAEVESSNEI